MGTVHNILEIWPGSHNLHATQKECRALNKQMAAVGDISDTEGTVKVTWLNIQRKDMAAFNLSEQLLLPPNISSKDLSGG